MKTKQEVLNRIEMLNKFRENATTEMKAEMEKVEKRIADNANDPTYVANWIGSWMRQVDYHKSRIEELTKELDILTWIVA